MTNNVKVAIVGALALAGTLLASVDANAMPMQDLSSSASSISPNLEHVWWRGGYGYRGYGYRGFGYRRFGYGYGWRRPFYGYGYGWRRPYYGWRRW